VEAGRRKAEMDDAMQRRPTVADIVDIADIDAGIDKPELGMADTSMPMNNKSCKVSCKPAEEKAKTHAVVQ
jgi:hypothetical protein